MLRNCGPADVKIFIITYEYAIKLNNILKNEENINLFINNKNYFPDIHFLMSYNIKFKVSILFSSDMIYISSGDF